MLKNRSEQIQLTVKLIDAIVCIAAFFLAYWTRLLLMTLNSGESGTIDSNTWLLGAALVVHFLLYPAFGFYRSLRLKTVAEILGMIFKSLVVDFFILGSLVFFFQAKSTSRGLFGLFLAYNCLLLLVERVGGRMLLSSVRRRGYNFRRVVIVGTGRNAIRTLETFKQHKHWGYLVGGFLRENSDDDSASLIGGVPVLGTLGDLEKIISRQTVDEVYFAMENLDGRMVGAETAVCEKLGIPARFVLGMFDLPNSRVTFSQLGAMPILTYYTTLMTPLEAVAKRLIDISVAVVGLVITGVLYPWIRWRIARESPGPAIFKQLRVGENGRRFKCYKFRSMALDADARKSELASANLMAGPIFKLENDPRVFPFGRFLRRTSLDELPQFFNILRGDMSVVGTRPPTPDEVGMYETHFRRRLSIRPGLTGLWQVSGRNKIRKFEEILELDLQYIDHWSIWLDIRIIFKTVWVIFRQRGAC